MNPEEFLRLLAGGVGPICSALTGVMVAAFFLVLNVVMIEGKWHNIVALAIVAIGMTTLGGLMFLTKPPITPAIVVAVVIFLALRVGFWQDFRSGVTEAAAEPNGSSQDSEGAANDLLSNDYKLSEDTAEALISRGEET